MDVTGMGNGRLDDVDAQIAQLQREREELVSPERTRVREAYEELEKILNRLEELGEDVSNGDGYTIYITGTRFSYTHDMGLQER